MSYPIPVPATYVPFPELAFCSNMLQNVSVPMAVGRDPVLLVGRAPLPLAAPVVWLAAGVGFGSTGWSYIVFANRSRHPAVRVSFGKRNSVSVTIAGQDVIRAFTVSDLHAEVAFLDLRPIGLDVTGTAEGLRVGEARLVGNTMSKLEVAVGLNLRPPEQTLPA